MNKYLFIIFSVFFVGLAGFFVLANNAENQRVENSPERVAMNEFVQCLADEDFVVYGSETCPACFRFAQQFGGYEVIDPIYVECSEEQENCRENMQTDFVPEIQIAGNLYEGPNGIEELAGISGCKLDVVEE